MEHGDSTHHFDPGALLARLYTLPSGLRVRLRLCHIREGDEIRALLSRVGEEPTELGLQRLLRHDPRRQLVIVATTLRSGRETVVGIGSIPLRRAAAPELLAVDDDVAEEVTPLLHAALVARAERLAA